MKRKELAKISLPVVTLERVDAIYAEVKPIACGGHCVDSCCPVGALMTAFERDRIIKRTGVVPNNHLSGDKRCNLLKDGRCSVHDIRPLICRLWGADVAMPCRFGCAGANSIPYHAGEKLVTRVVAATSDYRSPIKRA